MSQPFPTSFAALVLTGVLAMAASGCSTADPSANAAEPGLDAATAGLPSAAPDTTSEVPIPSPTESEPPPTSPSFGKTFTYGGGLAVTVHEPEPFRPSPWVDRLPGTAMRFEITVRNRTGEQWNPSQLHVRLLSGFAPAVQIFDYDHAVVARPENRLAAGRSATFWVGYWVTDADQLAIEFAPGFGYQAITVGG